MYVVPDPKVVIGINIKTALIICLINPICSVDKNLGKRNIEFINPIKIPE